MIIRVLRIIIILKLAHFETKVDEFYDEETGENKLTTLALKVYPSFEKAGGSINVNVDAVAGSSITHAIKYSCLCKAGTYQVALKHLSVIMKNNTKMYLDFWKDGTKTEEFTISRESAPTSLTLAKDVDQVSFYLASANIQNSGTISFVLTVSDGTLDDDIIHISNEILKVNTDICESLVFEQGSIDFARGIDATSSQYLRTSFCQLTNGCYLTTDNRCRVRVFYYDADKMYLSYSQLNEWTSTDPRYESTPSYISEGIAIPYIDDAEYIRFTIQKLSGESVVDVDITYADMLNATLMSKSWLAKQRFTGKVLQPHWNIVNAVLGSNLRMPDFSAILITDTHGDFSPIYDACFLQRYAKSKRPFRFTDIPILYSGDVFELCAKENGVFVDDYDKFISIAKRHSIYMTMGQHECGFTNTSISHDGTLKSQCLSTQEVIDKFIIPLRDSWGLPDLETPYYYKDFDLMKTRLITLYEFDQPMVDADGDSTHWKYDRGLICYSQTQINWLISTLNNNDNEYNVYMMQHTPINEMMCDETKSWGTGGKIGSYGVGVQGTVIFDILNAYNNRQTLVKDYTCDDDSALSISVNADFTNAKGKCMVVQNGDKHVDFIGTYTNSDIICLGLTATGAMSVDNVITYTSLKQYPNMPSDSEIGRTMVNVIGIQYTTRNAYIAKKMMIGRIGQQYSMTGQRRDILRLDIPALA